MVFQANKDNYGWHVDINQGLISNYNGWKNGVEMSEVASNLQVSLTSGLLTFAQTNVNTSAQTITFDAADATLTRRDLIAYDGNQFVVLKGTPQDDANTIAKPPSYVITDYVIVGMVKVRPGVTEFDSSDITDYRTYSSDSLSSLGYKNHFMFLGY